MAFRVRNLSAAQLMKTAPSLRASLALSFAFVCGVPQLAAADQNVTGNLYVSGTASVTGDTGVTGNLYVAGNTFELGSNSSSFGLRTLFAPTGSDGVSWRVTRLSAWLWEVDNAGTVLPAMRLDSSNNLVLYSGGTASLTLNPAAQSLALGSATLTASGTGLTTNGALSVTGAFTAPSLTANSGTLTGGTTGLTLNAGGNDQNITLTPSGTGSVVVPSRVTITNSTDSVSTSSGALQVSGGVGIAKTLYGRNYAFSYGLGTLPAGLKNGINTTYVSGTGDAGGTSDLRPNSMTVVGLGAANMSVRALDLSPVAQNSSGTAALVGLRLLTTVTNTGNANATAFSTSPYITGTGNMTYWTGYEADNGTFSSTGDVTGAMTAFRNGTFGRAAATTVTAFHAQDLTKGSGIAAGFRGQVSAATGKYNLYLDGTAANLLAGQTTITNTTASTDKNSGALTILGGMGVTGNISGGAQLNLSGGQTIYGQWNSTSTDARFEMLANGMRAGLLGWNSTQFILQADNGRSIGLNGGPVSIASTTSSTSPTTGALTIAGGMGVGGDLNVAGAFTASNFTAGQSAQPNQRISIFGANAGTSVVSNTDQAASLFLRNTNGGANTFADIRFEDAGGNSVAGVAGVLVNDAANQGDLSFTTRASGGNLSEKLRILGNGNVGIGVSNPGAKLEIGSGHILVNGTNANNQDLFIANAGGRKAELVTDANGNGKFMLRDSSGTTSQVSLSAGGSSYFNGGNLGVGTVAPASKLDVRATGTGIVPNIASIGHDTGGQFKFTADSGGSNYLHTRWATFDPVDARWEWTATTTTGASLLVFGTGANYELGFEVKNNGATTAGSPVNFVRALTLREEGATVPGNLTVGGTFTATSDTQAPGFIASGSNAALWLGDRSTGTWSTDSFRFQRVAGTTSLVNRVGGADTTVAQFSNSGFSTTSATLTGGTLTGGSTGLSLNAGGGNQGIQLNGNGTGDLVLRTNGNERIRVESTGTTKIRNPGNPASYPLLVESVPGQQIAALFQSQNNLNGNGAYLGSIGWFSADEYGLFDAGADQPIAVYTPTDSNVHIGTSLVSNTVTGQVGIGTATPSAKLEVSGTMKVTGATRFDGPVRIAPQGDLSMGGFDAEPTN